MVKGPEAPVYVNGHNGPTLQIQFIARKSAGDYFNIESRLAAVSSPQAIKGPLRNPAPTLP
jgi:hypothetical protein